MDLGKTIMMDGERAATAATLLPAGEKVPAEQADEGSAGGTATPHPALRAIFSPAGRRVASLAIGLGFRKTVTAEALAALVHDALFRLPEHFADRAAVLATIAEKDRPPLREAAERLGLDVVILPKTALAGTGDRITVASGRVRACFGIPSVAEAAALAAAGPGSRLVVARIATADATCAIAIAGAP